MGSFPFLLSTFFLSWDLILNLELAVEARLAAVSMQGLPLSAPVAQGLETHTAMAAFL